MIAQAMTRARTATWNHIRIPRLGTLVVMFISLLMLLPFLWLVYQATKGGMSTSLEVASLLRSLGLTATVVAGTMALTLAVGVGCGWLCVMCRFPGVGLMQVALLLPLTMPPYLVAYIYSSLFEETGLGFFRGVTGTILSLSFATYPYVFLFAMTAFLLQPCHLYSSARVLGLTPVQTFLRVSVPVARPSIIAGLALVMMEAMGDFGVAEYFGLSTLSVAVYDTWLNRGDFGGASQLALITILAVFFAVFAERLGTMRHRHYTQAGKSFCCDQSYTLRGANAALALATCLMVLLLAFAVPFFTLLRLSFSAGAASWRLALQDGMLNSFLIAAVVSVLTLVTGILLAVGARGERGRHGGARKLFARLSVTGYAFPGTILALAVLGSCFGLAALLKPVGIDLRVFLVSTVFMLCVGLTVKFLIITHSAGEAGLKKIPPSISGVARLNGMGTLATVVRVYLPLLRPALLASLMLVFVDVIKELPLTLLLRPAGFDTLSTYVFQYASDEEILRAAPAGLLLVVMGLPAIIVVRQFMDPRWRAVSMQGDTVKRG